MSDETYNGWKNRETWAFNLHWRNDEGLYAMVREMAGGILEEGPETTDLRLGERTIEYVCEILGESDTDHARMVESEVGSFWRVDATETGAAVREDLS